MVKDYRITRGCSIKKASPSTKICPVCGGKIIPKLMHIAIEVWHERERSNFSGHKNKYYLADNVYIHIECFAEFAKLVNKKIIDIRGNYRQNKLKVIAEAI